MEKSSPEAGVLAHGPDPAQTSHIDSSVQPGTVSDEKTSGLARSPSLVQSKRSSLPPRSNSNARHAKRLTLNFPINIPTNQSPISTPDTTITSPASMTPITQSSTRPSPALPTGASIPLELEDDGYDFLRAIASQERRVLELREELQRAETDLTTLKKQWAIAEKSRKRTEISHHAEQMLPLRSPDTSVPPDASSSGSGSHRREQSMSSVGSSAVSHERVSRELDRRPGARAAAAPGSSISSNGRRVFQGSHTRALSLLSTTTAPSHSSAGPILTDADRVGRTPRSATLPSVERSHNVTSSKPLASPAHESAVPSQLLSQWSSNMPPPSREAFMRTGKQMASDLREGLWTFFEDIRQATVGEEGVNGTTTRTMSPNRSLAPPESHKRNSLAKSSSRERLSVAGINSKPVEIDTSFWHEFGVDSPVQKSPTARPSPPNGARTPRGEDERERPGRRSASQVKAEEDDTVDNWDVWDTPAPNKTTHTPSSSRSTIESKQDQSPATQGSSARTSDSFGEWNPISTAPDPSVTEGIPWPSMPNLAPSKLQRTASTLMAEWERSLSPSPERKTSSKSSKKD
ncbi:hypothetical protein N7468_007855 [Penicillium chermesinum]|uniref:DUF4048 domain-containing protein n=1 Tax=Penicillium chermesinum TaxID=63820 RepID=A0A9W9NR02_9EURO|nr:uncharacterized protein N7468_007855 [Penicillium chermesinum]KAJ5223313.1 hypothetical protein N7468_007855 [Penicillium chermesinum]